MAKYLRHFLWIKSLSGWSHPVIAVFDEVQATKSSFKKTCLLHTRNQPTVSGTLVYAKNGTGMVYQRTVYPVNPSIAVVGGSGKEYWVDGKNYPPSRGAKSGEEPGAWRVEVSPSVARTQDEFLHILYPTSSSSGQPPSVRSIDAGSMKGFETGGVVVLFAVNASSVTSASYSLSAARENLLFGVKPGGSYDVLVGGSRAATLKASVEGTLAFQNASTGTIQVVLR
jgi:heparin/heparan-sulfate lyase